MAVPARRRLRRRPAAPPRRLAPALAARRRRAGACRGGPAGGRPRDLRRPLRPARDAAAEGIDRLRFATGVDDDLRPFHDRFRDDPVIGRAVRANPHLRVRRKCAPVGGAAGRGHRAADRVRARGRDPAPADRPARPPLPALRPARPARARGDRRPGAGAGSRRSTSPPSARSRCAAARSRWPPAASTSTPTTSGACSPSPRSAPGPSRSSGSTGRAAWTSSPPATSASQARRPHPHGQPAGTRRGARGARVLRAATASGRASPASTCAGRRRAGLIPSRAHPARTAPGSQRLPRQELGGERGAAVRLALDQPVALHPQRRSGPTTRGPGSPRAAGVDGREEDVGFVALIEASCSPRSRSLSALSSASTPACGCVCGRRV